MSKKKPKFVPLPPELAKSPALSLKEKFNAWLARQPSEGRGITQAMGCERLDLSVSFLARLYSGERVASPETAAGLREATGFDWPAADDRGGAA